MSPSVSTPAPVVLPPLDSTRLSPNRSSRHGEQVHLIVCHRPAGSYAGAVATLLDPASQVSAHIVLREGGTEATQLVPWAEKAWACKAFNAFSDNLELPDAAWLGDDPAGLAVSARIVAFRCAQRGIPPVWTRNPLEQPGVCRHFDLGLAGGGHTDPTTAQGVWLGFMGLVLAEYHRGGFRKHWGI